MWYRIQGVIGRRQGVGAVLTPERQVVLVSREGLFVPPAEVLRLSLLGEGAYIVLYDALPECALVLERESGEKETVARVYTNVKRFDDGYIFINGERKRVFPFSVSQIALWTALSHGAQYVKYVLDSVKEPVVIDFEG